MSADLFPRPERRTDLDAADTPKATPGPADSTGSRRLTEAGRIGAHPLPNGADATEEPTDAERLLTVERSGPADGPAVQARPTAPDTAPPDSTGTNPMRDAVVSRSEIEPAPRHEAAGAGPDTAPDSARSRILDAAADRAAERLEQVCAHYGVDDPRDIAAVATARDAITRNLAPVVVEGVCRMLPDLRAKVAEHPETIIEIVYRDGASIGAGIQALDPDLYDAHCRPVFLSRKTTEEAAQDEEIHAKKTFPTFAGEFRDPDRADRDEVPGAAMRTTRHLLLSGVPVGTPGARVIVVDSGHKGTIQEGQAARYPNVEFQGAYLFHIRSVNDQNPENKRGYLMHITPDRTFPEDPDDPARGFEEKDPTFVFEQLLHGPMSTTFGHDDRGRALQNFEPPPTRQINPMVIAPQYSDPFVRAAVVDLAQRDVADYARVIAEFDEAGLDYRTGLAEDADSGMRTVRDWAHGHDTGDPEFDTVADSFVRREDKHLVARLRDTLTDLDDHARDDIWRGFQQLTLDDKKRYVENLVSSAGSSPSPLPTEGTSHG